MLWRELYAGCLPLPPGPLPPPAGTFPMQSERFYQALKGHGGTTRLVLLPHESHGYSARESIMHVLYEMDRCGRPWLGGRRQQCFVGRGGSSGVTHRSAGTHPVAAVRCTIDLTAGLMGMCAAAGCRWMGMWLNGAASSTDE